VTLADRDEVLLVAPSRTFVLEFRKPAYFWRWTWWRTVRERVQLRTLPLRELQQIQRTYAELEKTLGLDLTTAVAVLIGPAAFYLSPTQVAQLWEAHCELNLIPKVTVAAAEEASPTQPSSEGSNVGPSSTNENGSSK
jgi:hypothetical protein